MTLFSQINTANMPAAYTGAYSSVSLVAVFIICAVSFCLFFAICVMAVLGRFSKKKMMRPWGDDEIFAETLQHEQRPPQQMKQDDDAPPFDMQPAASDASLKNKGVGNEKSKEEKPQTGLWQLVGAFAIFIPALVAFNLFESPMGRMQSFVPNTILEALFFTAQVFLLVWGALLQKRQ